MQNKKYDVSIVVLTYNPAYKELESTLLSIINQKDCKFEIVMSDDNSKEDISVFVKEFFKKIHFYDYKLIINKKNIGTVKNLKIALENCSSQYVKDVGQGDLLYSEYTLKEMLNSIGSADFIFGLAAPFNRDGMVKSHILKHQFEHSLNVNKRYLKRNCFVFDYYPNGATFLFKRNVMLNYICQIEGVVIYCEDLVFKLMVLDDVRIKRLQKFVVYYECESGISNNLCESPRVIKDTINFNELLLSKMDKYNKLSIMHYKHIIRLRTNKLKETNYKKIFLIRLLISIIDIRIPLSRLMNKIKKYDSLYVDDNYLKQCITQRRK